MELLLNFSADMNAGAPWVGPWVNFMGIVLLLAIPFALSKSHLKSEARWTLLSMVGVFPMMMWLYSQYGYSRILGLPHVVFWTPLVIWLISRRRRWLVRETMVGKWMLLLVATLCVSLAFDYTDVVRHFLDL
ncbi:MAG: hypothetical protein V3V30_05200 [Parvularculaceae bacterium]